MIAPERFLQALQESGIDFYAGVPDSLLKEFCSCLQNKVPATRHVICANEGTAIALGSGFHLATGRVPLVYLQNSGLGNTINPLLSLVDPEVYGLPIVLLVGWRGEPGIKDEPQHIKQGRVTPALLDSIEVPHLVLPDDPGATVEAVQHAAKEALRRHGAFALLAREGLFDKGPALAEGARRFNYPMTRERAIECIHEALPEDAAIVSTTGKLSRELYEMRKRAGTDHRAAFLTVGSMGHASQIALGLSMGDPHRPVVVLDGDGAAIMHMGGLATIGSCAPKRFFHILLNNGAHESVGGQPTVAFDADLTAIARAAGYTAVPPMVSDEADLRRALEGLFEIEGPVFLEVRVNVSSRKDLGRPKETPKENKDRFMARFQQPSLREMV